MSVPEGYCTVREAIAAVLEEQRAGEPFSPAVEWARSEGVETSYDRAEWKAAIAFFWSEFQAGRIVVIAEQPSTGQMVRLAPEDLDGIPLLYSSTGDLSSLRPSHSAHRRLHERFGAPGRLQLLVAAAAAVGGLRKRAREARKREAARARRGSRPLRGRPSKLLQVMGAIRQVVEAGRWRAPQSVKALAYQVNRLDRNLDASDSTVRRALERLYEATGDRKHQRVKKARALDQHRTQDPLPS